MGNVKQARVVLDNAKQAAPRNSPYHADKDKKLKFLAEVSKRLSHAELSIRSHWRY